MTAKLFKIFAPLTLAAGLAACSGSPKYAEPGQEYCEPTGDGDYQIVDPATNKPTITMGKIHMRRDDYVWGDSSTDPTGTVGFNVHLKNDEITFCELAGNDGEGRRFYPKDPSGPN